MEKLFQKVKDFVNYRINLLIVNKIRDKMGFKSLTFRRRLGSGGFGKVLLFRARYNNKSFDVAIKIIKKWRNGVWKVKNEMIENEYKLGKKMENLEVGPEVYGWDIITSREQGAGLSSSLGFIVMEPFNMDSLKYIQKFKDDEQRINICQKMIILFTNSINQLICYDVKPHNFLVKCDNYGNLEKVVMSDFDENFCVKNTRQSERITNFSEEDRNKNISALVVIQLFFMIFATIAENFNTDLSVRIKYLYNYFKTGLKGAIRELRDINNNNNNILNVNIEQLNRKIPEIPNLKVFYRYIIYCLVKLGYTRIYTSLGGILIMIENILNNIENRIENHFGRVATTNPRSLLSNTIPTQKTPEEVEIKIKPITNKKEIEELINFDYSFLIIDNDLKKDEDKIDLEIIEPNEDQINYMKDYLNQEEKLNFGKRRSKKRRSRKRKSRKRKSRKRKKSNKRKSRKRRRRSKKRNK